MLQIAPTEHLTGVTVRGDFQDFYELVDSIYRLCGLDDDREDIYYGVKNRLLGACYEIRHAFMGDREIALCDNGMTEDLMKYRDVAAPTQNVYDGTKLLFPEAIFLAAAVPEMMLFSSMEYGERGKLKHTDLPGLLYGDYLRDKANLYVFCSGIWQALGTVIGDESLEKLMYLKERTHETYMNYVTHYIDKCNIELLRAPQEKRKDKLRNIAKRIIDKPKTYRNMEEDLKYWAKEYKTSIYELEDPGLVYPEEMEW